MDNPNLELETEDKARWAALGQELEQDFIEKIVPHLGLDIALNPEKVENIYAPDLLANGRVADLKCQKTPFFTARRYRKDPGRTVTFNRKDLERYKRLYPDIEIYFYVRWTQLEYHNKPTITVEPLHGVWLTTVEHIDSLVTEGKAPEHAYQKRIDDKRGNAKSSFLVSLDDLTLLKDLGT